MVLKSLTMSLLQSGSDSAGKPAEIFQQMEELRRELRVLARRAEEELEALVRADPQSVIRMLRNFASEVKAVEAQVCFDPQCSSFAPLEGMAQNQLFEQDFLQCRLALSGREMAMDFTKSRVYLPVVLFENPIAVAVFTVPSLSSGSYEAVCRAASSGICSLRTELRTPVILGQDTETDAAS